MSWAIFPDLENPCTWQPILGNASPMLCQLASARPQAHLLQQCKAARLLSTGIFGAKTGVDWENSIFASLYSTCNQSESAIPTGWTRAISEYLHSQEHPHVADNAIRTSTASTTRASNFFAHFLGLLFVCLLLRFSVSPVFFSARGAKPSYRAEITLKSNDGHSCIQALIYVANSSRIQNQDFLKTRKHDVLIIIKHQNGNLSISKSIKGFSNIKDVYQACARLGKPPRAQPRFLIGI